MRGHVHRDPGGRRPLDRFSPRRGAGRHADPVLQRPRRPRVRRRRARGPRLRGQAARRRRRRGRHPGDDDAGVRHPYPEEFLELLEARRPDPQTGQPDFERLGAFLAAHPEAQTAIQGTIGVGPLASFATGVYYSPHTFYLVDSAGERAPVRLRWIPDLGEQRLDDDDAKARGRDYLYEDLEQRLEGDGSIGFELRFQRAAPEDPIDDATALWPDDREFVAAGTLAITARVNDPERDDHIDVFDPLRLPDGIEPSNDPILHARHEAYSVSAYRRWGRERGPAPS